MSITVRELRTHLSEYLRRARQGESIEVTSHGEVVAHLVPAGARESSIEALRRQPWITPGKSGARLGLDRPIAWSGEGPSFTDLLLEDRENSTGETSIG